MIKYVLKFRYRVIGFFDAKYNIAVAFQSAGSMHKCIDSAFVVCAK